MDHPSNKIIYINCGNPTTATIRRLFFLDIIEELGYEVEYWSLFSYFNPCAPLGDELDSPLHFRFKEMEDFKQGLMAQDKQHCLVIVACDLYYVYKEMFKALHQSGLYVVRIYPYSGATHLNFSFKDKIQRIFRSNIWQKFLRNFRQKSFLFYFKHFVDKQLIKEVYSSSLPRTKAINHPDYERYMILRKEQDRLLDGPYIVFLDMFFPKHHDLKIVFHLKNLCAENYYRSMRRFFDQLEERYGIPVVVAAHPKSEYQGDEFGERKIIKYHTDNLVKYANGVISHYSTSTAYALLFDKPVGFISCNDMIHSTILRLTLTNYALQLHKTLYNIDTDSFDTFDLSPVSREDKEKYLYTSLTSKETENVPNKEFFRSELKRLFDKIAHSSEASQSPHKFSRV